MTLLFVGVVLELLVLELLVLGLLVLELLVLELLVLERFLQTHLLYFPDPQARREFMFSLK